MHGYSEVENTQVETKIRKKSYFLLKINKCDKVPRDYPKSRSLREGQERVKPK